MTYKEIILEIEQQYSKEEVLDLFMKTVNEFADIEQMQKEDIKTELDYYIKHGKDKELEKFILKFVDPRSVTRLSNEGEEKMNCYAQGGFDNFLEVCSSIDNLDSFLIQYYELMNKYNNEL